jgi:hypothetical protein
MLKQELVEGHPPPLNIRSPETPKLPERSVVALNEILTHPCRRITAQEKYLEVICVLNSHPRERWHRANDKREGYCRISRKSIIYRYVGKEENRFLERLCAIRKSLEKFKRQQTLAIIAKIRKKEDNDDTRAKYKGEKKETTESL